MNYKDIFQKTGAGQAEIEANSSTLDMIERRVLILVNGQKDVETLEKFSLCENIGEVVDSLVSKGMIEMAQVAPVAPAAAPATAAPAPVASGGGAPVTGAQEFMVNTLLTFANRVRVSKLIDQIESTQDTDSVKTMVKPWYQAISETPGGMYQADDLKKEVLEMIHNLETAA